MIHGVLKDNQNGDIFVLPMDINKVSPRPLLGPPIIHYYKRINALYINCCGVCKFNICDILELGSLIVGLL